MSVIYMLDTNIISELAKPRPSEKMLNMLELKSPFCGICSPVWYEAIKGLEAMPEGKKKQTAEIITYDYIQGTYPIINYDKHAASMHARIFSELKKCGKTPPTIDAMIASIAISNNLILVTRNIKDYEPIREHFSLCVENWFE